MSNYQSTAINPRTGQAEDCWYLDDYFGRYKYGVKFADGFVYREEDVEVIGEDEEEP